MTPRVSEQTTKRLCLYLRFLGELEASRVETISSKAMAEHLQLNASQIRKDLACFGDFGIRGVGYEVVKLRRVIAKILGLNQSSRVVIVGAGNLGKALADYPGFNGAEFEVVALFDVDPAKVGRKTRQGTPIHALEAVGAVIREHDVEIGIVAVPAEASQDVVDMLVAGGVRAILNFAPARPQVPEGIRCNHVDLKVELENLSFFLSEHRAQQHPFLRAF